MQKLDRITFNPNVMGGKPCIRGMRVTVGMILVWWLLVVPMPRFWMPIPTWKRKIFVNPFPMPRGEFKKLKCQWVHNENAN